VARGLFGLLIGFTLPLATTLISEITPIELRGKSLVVLDLNFTLGILFSCFAAWLTLDDLTSGNWRAMLILSTLPAVVVWFGSWRYLYESPRYQMVMGQIEESCETLNKIGLVNKGEQYTKITEAEKTAISDWQRNNFKTEDVANIKALFSDKFKGITSSLWLMWWSLNFLQYGLVFILPFILSTLDSSSDYKGVRGLSGFVIMILGELPTLVVAFYIIDNKTYGRRNSLIVSFAAGAITFLIAYSINTEFFFEVLSVARAFVKMGFIMINALTAELYPTSYRTSGLGIASGVGKIGASMMPWFCVTAYEYSTFAPIILFAIVSGIGAVASYMIPYDTSGRALDIQEEKRRSLLNKDTDFEMRMRS